MKRFVVYTVLVGDYDDILQPVVIDDRFDYVLFSNDIHEPSIGVWSVRPIPHAVENDNKRLSRYPKTHPETLLSDYKASLYIDANIQIQDQWVYDRFIKIYDQNIQYAGIKLVLTGRDCIYEHAYDMCMWRIENEVIALKQCHALYEKGFPRHFGLNENNVIFRIHTDTMRRADEEWWTWIKDHSSRDQLSYMYCLWKYGIDLNYFLPVGEDTRNGSHFILVNHDSRGLVKKIKLKKISLIKRVYNRCKRFDEDRSLRKWLSFIESKHPVTRYFVDMISTIAVNIPNLFNVVLKRLLFA